MKGQSNSRRNSLGNHPQHLKVGFEVRRRAAQVQAEVPPLPVLKPLPAPSWVVVAWLPPQVAPGQEPGGEHESAEHHRRSKLLAAAAESVSMHKIVKMWVPVWPCTRPSPA